MAASSFSSGLVTGGFPCARVFKTAERTRSTWSRKSGSISSVQPFSWTSSFRRSAGAGPLGASERDRPFALLVKIHRPSFGEPAHPVPELGSDRLKPFRVLGHLALDEVEERTENG